MKLIIQFNRGQYSPFKDEFKDLYTKSFKWNTYKNGWYGKGGFVIPTEKMEPGNPVTFHVECSEKIAEALKSFCDSDLHKIIYNEVQRFNSFSSIPQMLPTEVIETKIIKEEPKLEGLPWMCFAYHYNHWEYRKEQLISEWDPNFKVIWK